MPSGEAGARRAEEFQVEGEKFRTPRRCVPTFCALCFLCGEMILLPFAVPISVHQRSSAVKTFCAFCGSFRQLRRFIAIKLVYPGFGRKVDAANGASFTRRPTAPGWGVPSPLIPCTAMPVPPSSRVRDYGGQGRIGGPETDINQEKKEQSYDHSHRKSSVSHHQRAESHKIST